jgi:hypothetical protein
MGYKQCSVDGCIKNSVAKGLCDLHYRRQLHHGNINKGRPVDWGVRGRHPLYHQWTWMRRSFQKGVDPTWKDFWVFVKDVGARPSENHIISRLDTGDPFGPKNFFWREKVLVKERSESQKEYQRRYAKAYRQENPEKMRRHDLRKKYGIGVQEYDELLQKQSHVCAICRQPETYLDSRTGQPFRLAVDHCHDKKHVRGLLCRGCNQGLGNFRDDPQLLRAAVAYLDGPLN